MHYGSNPAFTINLIFIKINIRFDKFRFPLITGMRILLETISMFCCSTSLMRKILLIENVNIRRLIIHLGIVYPCAVDGRKIIRANYSRFYVINYPLKLMRVRARCKERSLLFCIWTMLICFEHLWWLSLNVWNMIGTSTKKINYIKPNKTIW